MRLRPWASRTLRALTNCSRFRWMARFCSSCSLGTRMSARASRLPWTKRSNFKQSALASRPSVFTLFVALIEFLRANHVAMDPQSVETPLQSKPKPARLIDGIDFNSLAAELGGPEQECFLAETLRRLGIGPALLFDHHVIILVHINPELDDSFAPIKLRAGSLK